MIFGTYITLGFLAHWTQKYYKYSSKCFEGFLWQNIVYGALPCYDTIRSDSEELPLHTVRVCCLIYLDYTGELTVSRHVNHLVCIGFQVIDESYMRYVITLVERI